MFRENVLTNDEIIDRISTTMIPVVVDYQKAQDPNTREGKFLLPLMKQRKQDQGVWIFSPEGKALGGFVGFGDMVAQTRKTIDDALKAFGSVAPRHVAAQDTQPHRGKGIMPNGGVCIAEYVRRYGNDLFSHGKSPVISSVVLSEKEFRALAPKEVVAGKEWKIPDNVAKRLSRLTSPVCYQHAPQPDWITAVRLAGRVKAVKDGIATITYEGFLSSTHRANGQKFSDQEVNLTGEGVYDLKSKQLVSLMLVGNGTLRWTEAPNKPAPFNALAEWSLSK